MGSSTEGDTDHYAAIIVGSGQGGTPLATAYAKAGHKTLLVEAAHIGGTCINEGCTPTKTMVASARVCNLTVRAPEYGVKYKRSSLVLEIETVRKRKRDIVESFRGGSEKRLESTANLDVLHGRAKFIGERKLEVTSTVPGSGAGLAQTRSVSGDKVFLNVGCQPAPLTVKYADKIPHLNSTTIMELSEVPRHLVVIGGGPIGLEFGQMFRRFGAKVSIIQRGPHLLPREDEDVSQCVQKILTEDNIDLYLDAQVREISRVPTGMMTVSLDLPKQQRPNTFSGEETTIKTLTCSHLLAAAGRAPNTADLGLHAAGVEVDARGFIKVSADLATTADGVFSLGDVNAGSPQFTHVSYDDFRILKHNLLENTNGTSRSTENRLVAAVTYMDPQVARVGETTASARKRWPERNLGEASMPMTWVARALEVNETRGLMKGVVDLDTDEILGFVCVGIEGGELMSVVQTAMLGKLKYTDLETTVFAHPTLAESLNNLWANMKSVPAHGESEKK